MEEDRSELSNVTLNQILQAYAHLSISLGKIAQRVERLDGSLKRNKQRLERLQNKLQEDSLYTDLQEQSETN